jgi:zinc protease
MSSSPFHRSDAPAAARSGLSPMRVTLPNGLVVLARETRKTPAVTINLALRSGAVCDPPWATGALNLLARMLDRGTVTRTAADIADVVDSRGATLSIGITRHLISIVCTCLADDFAAVLELLADIVIAPSFPASELPARQREIITSLAQDQDSPYVRAAETLMAMLYGSDHPYGRPMKGSAEDVARLDRTALETLHRESFAPSEAIAVIVGDVPEPRAIDEAARVLGAWRAPMPRRPVLARPSRPAVRRRMVIPMMNKAQADIAYGFVSIARADPAFYAHWLMNNVLGQYALGGRLGDSIRERQGMAYYVSSNLEAQVIEGPLFIRAGVSPEHVDRAIASIDAELHALRDHGVTPRELEESRHFLIGSMPRTLETNAGIASFLQRIEVFGLGLDFDVRVAELLRAVTLDDVNAAARTLDPAQATIVVAGPYQDT